MVQVKAFNTFYSGTEGKIKMQTLALQIFLRNEGVSVVVFQGTIKGRNKTYSIKRKF